MCGRITLTTDKDDILGFYRPSEYLDLIKPRYNIAPSQNSPVVTVKEDRRVLNMMRWGLIPFWAKEAKIGYKLINAKAETVSEKPSFRKPFKDKRCLVLADGFYEWNIEASWFSYGLTYLGSPPTRCTLILKYVSRKEFAKGSK
jgi:putative SOS response-associated peptidase YedK